jgi:hypothetical protein
MDVRVVGADHVAKGLEDVLRAVPRLDANAVGNVILQAARARTPVRSGQLRASGRAQGMNVVYTAPYAAPIHWGWKARNIKPNKFLYQGAEASADAWLQAFTDALQEDLDRKV